MLDTGSIAATSVLSSEDAQGLLLSFNDILAVKSSKSEKGKERELEWDIRSRFSLYTRDDIWWMLPEEPKKAMLMHSAAMHPKVTKYFFYYLITPLLAISSLLCNRASHTSVTSSKTSTRTTACSSP